MTLTYLWPFKFLKKARNIFNAILFVLSPLKLSKAAADRSADRFIHFIRSVGMMRFDGGSGTELDTCPSVGSPTRNLSELDDIIADQQR